MLSYYNENNRKGDKMSHFSDMLSSFVQDRGMTYSQLSKYSGIERTMTYRLMNGTRHPSDKGQVDAICETLQLSLVQQKNLLRAYYIDSVGAETFLRREYLNEQFSNPWFLRDITPKMIAPVKKIPSGQVMIVNGRHAVIELAESIVSDEADDMSGKGVRIFINPAVQAFWDMIFMLAARYPALKIQHLLVFENSKKSDRDVTNLKTLFSALPLIRKNRNYETRVFYNELEKVFSETSVFPCFIVTEHALLECTADGYTGRLIREKNVVGFYISRFDRLFRENSSLAKSYTDLNDFVQYIQYFMKFNNKASDDANFLFETQASVLRYMPPKIMMKVMNERLAPALKTTIKEYMHQEMVIRTRKKKEAVQCYFYTKAGIRAFLSEGIIRSVPDLFYNRVSREDAKVMLKLLIQDAREGDPQVRMLDENRIRLPAYLAFSSSEKKFGVAFYLPEADFCTIDISERSLTNAFFDYLTYLSNSEACAGQEESIAWLESALK